MQKVDWLGMSEWLLFEADRVLGDEAQTQAAMMSLASYSASCDGWWQAAGSASAANHELLTVAYDEWSEKQSWPELPPVARAAMSWRFRIAAAFVRAIGIAQKAHPGSRVPGWIRRAKRADFVRWLLLEAAGCWTEMTCESFGWAGEFQHHWLASRPSVAPPNKDSFAM